MEHHDLPLRLRLLLLDVLLEPPVPEWLTEEDWGWIEHEVREVVLLLLGEAPLVARIQ